MDHFRIRPLSEPDIDQVFAKAGGCRVHLDVDRRAKRGADYILGNALIELKALDDEGLEKPERQAKLAALFRKQEPERPVIILDRERLPKTARRDYDYILGGPIKTLVSSARKQLKQSRTEIPSATSSILFVINNGYTALNHDQLLRMVAHRVRNDTREIDGVVVGGCYYYSDAFDSFFLWPIEYVPLELRARFEAFSNLREAWNNFANQFMTDLMQGKVEAGAIKGPVVDTQFEVDGITLVKPAPPMGEQSQFYGPLSAPGATPLELLDVRRWQ